MSLTVKLSCPIFDPLSAAKFDWPRYCLDSIVAATADLQKQTKQSVKAPTYDLHGCQSFLLLCYLKKVWTHGKNVEFSVGPLIRNFNVEKMEEVEEAIIFDRLIKSSCIGITMASIEPGKRKIEPVQLLKDACAATAETEAGSMSMIRQEIQVGLDGNVNDAGSRTEAPKSSSDVAIKFDVTPASRECESIFETQDNTNVRFIGENLSGGGDLPKFDSTPCGENFSADDGVLDLCGERSPPF